VIVLLRAGGHGRHEHQRQCAECLSHHRISPKAV
jgi:hypothetical protein